MDKETIKQIQEKIDKALLAQGIDPTIGDFNRNLKQELEQKAREKLAEEIKRQVSESIEEMVAEKVSEIQSANENFKNQVVEAIKEVKIDNQVDIGSVEMPTINVPEPKVTVNVPKIDVPSVEMPKEIEVKGFGGFVKAVFEILKNQITVKLGGIDRDKPLPVILVDEKGIYYKAISNMIASGGGGSIKGLMNVAGTIINPATEDKQDDILEAIQEMGGSQYTLIFVQDGDDVYWAEALPGSETTDEVWRANKYENSTGRILFADGNDNFDNRADDLTNLSYS